MTLDIGARAEAAFVVRQSDTAAALAIPGDDPFPAVLATSRMIALMEVAAARVLRPVLEDGQLSVGVSLQVRHTAATPPGGNVRAVATYLGPDAKLFKFKVEAFDDTGPIGDGEHTRAIVTTDRLLAGAQKRQPQPR